MRLVSRAMIAAGLAALAAGCTTALPPAKIDAIGPAFNQAVKDGYVQLASAEFGALEFFERRRFQNKARMAMLGDTVWPDKVSDLDIPAAAQPEALVLRERLVDALERNARAQAPVDAAAAQVNFDCWLQELEDGADPAAMSTCKLSFLSALQEAEEVVAPVPVPGEPFRVVFDGEGANLGTDAFVAIDAAASAVRTLQPRQVRVVGYADRPGAPSFSLPLPQRRAQAVANALQQAGVPAGAIVTEGRAAAPGGAGQGADIFLVE